MSNGLVWFALNPSNPLIGLSHRRAGLSARSGWAGLHYQYQSGIPPRKKTVAADGAQIVNVDVPDMLATSSANLSQSVLVSSIP